MCYQITTTTFSEELVDKILEAISELDPDSFSTVKEIPDEEEENVEE